jgi:hypothetical protein
MNMLELVLLLLLLLLQVFASLYTLSRNRKTTDWRWTAARVVLEFLQVRKMGVKGFRGGGHEVRGTTEGG